MLLLFQTTYAIDLSLRDTRRGKNYTILVLNVLKPFLLRNADHLLEFMGTMYIFHFNQMPIPNNTRSSVRQCSVSTVILHAVQILQKSRNGVAFDKTTSYVPSATNATLPLKYIYLMLFSFPPHVMVHLACTPNVISFIRNLPNKNQCALLI